MCKKLLAAAVAVAVGVAIVGTPAVRDWVGNRWNDVVSYCQADNQARETPEKRIQRLRVEIGKIRGEVEKSVNNLVKMKLDAQEQDEALRPLEKQRAAREAELQSMTVALENASNQVSFQNVSYARDEFKHKVVEATRGLTNLTSAVENRKKALQSKHAAVDALDRQIRKMQDKEVELNALADRLEAKLQELKLKQLENSVAVDASKVSECEALAKQIERMLKEEDLKAEEYTKFGLTNAPEKAPAEEVKTDEEVLKAAREALGQAAPKAPAAKN
jgi:chromosome segregation ATPase